MRANKGSVGRRRTDIVKRTRPKYRDPIIGMGSTSFLKHLRQVDREKFGSSDPKADRARKRLLFLGPVPSFGQENEI